MLCILEHVTWSKQPNSGGVSGTRGATYVEVNVIIITFSVWRDSYVYTLRNDKFHRVSTAETVTPDTVVLSLC